MAAEDLVPVVSLQGFKGLQTSKAQPYLEPGEAVTSSNCNPTIIKGALLPERGRVEAVNLTTAYLALQSVSVVFPIVFSGTGAYPYVPAYIVQGLNASSALVTAVYFPLTGAIGTISGGRAFTQAVQYGSVVYTNAGQRVFLASLAAAEIVSQFYDWQYPPINFPLLGYAISSGPTNSLGIGTYWYIYTHTTTMPDGTISETSVNLDSYADNANLGYGHTVSTANSEITITLAGGGNVWTGTNDDGTTFTTNIYRTSTNQPGYYFVANQTTNTPYVDTASDESIVSNQMLEVHRDPPPVSANNQGFIEIHKSSVWCFVNYAEGPDPYAPPPTELTSYQTQCQLWYSNPGRPWEFDDSAQVLLADSDVTVTVSSTANPNGLYYYDQPYGNAPRGMATVGTILCAFKQREMWAVLGDNSSNFIARNYFGIGCTAPYSITPVLGGVYWLSESGDIYSFDGSAPNYVSADLRNFIRAIPGVSALEPITGINPIDLAEATGFFSNFTYYLAFPTRQQTVGYSIPDKVWTSILPYAPATSSAVASVPANPNQVQPLGRIDGTSLNEVIVGRYGSPGILDWYFVDPNNDLGQPMTYSWQGGVTPSRTLGYQEKQYSFATLFAPVGQQGSAVVTLQVDALEPIVWNIPDLSVPPRLLQKSLGVSGTLVRGFQASLSISVTGVATQPAPQIWAVDVYGCLPPDRKQTLRV